MKFSLLGPLTVAADDGEQLEVRGRLQRAVLTALLARAIGDRRAEDDSAALTETALICGRLPLALRIAAARLRHRPAWTVADLVERLRGQQHRLDEPASEDRGIAGAFAVSYEHLSAGLRRTYRLLSVVPGPDFDAHLVAALAGASVPGAGASGRRLEAGPRLRRPGLRDAQPEPHRRRAHLSRRTTRPPCPCTTRPSTSSARRTTSARKPSS